MEDAGLGERETRVVGSRAFEKIGCGGGCGESGDAFAQSAEGLVDLLRFFKACS